ncbi:MAG: glycosyltransferase family 2 protein [Phycisphaerae bacterium]|jgi:glycosyltransferase involved in cell wall biosynthesis|nr:glycosyltransferase family 2 protein [Phycisphaerae bacterium]
MDINSHPAQPPQVYCSVVVPFFNEEELVDRFYNRLAKVMRKLDKSYEIILVNDGSTDRTGEILEQIALRDQNVLLVDFKRNFGQTPALQAGFDHARGEIIVALDGDMENDSFEIPIFLDKIAEGYDIVSGWRKRRQHGWLLRRIPSMAANWSLRRISGVDLHDFGVTFKAYRREVLENIRLYGDMHRFVPAVCSRLGARTCEIVTKHINRPAGESKYGLGRTFRVALDLITLRFTTAYLTRPLHFFGKGGLTLLALGAVILTYGLIRKIIGWFGDGFDLFTVHGPLMALGFMSIITAFLLLATGLIGEMLMRIYFESTGARTYHVKKLVGLGQDADAPPGDSDQTGLGADDTPQDHVSPPRSIMT